MKGRKKHGLERGKKKKMKKKPVTGVDDGKTKKDQQGARTGSVHSSTNERLNHNHLEKTRRETVVIGRPLPFNVL